MCSTSEASRSCGYRVLAFYGTRHAFRGTDSAIFDSRANSSRDKRGHRLKTDGSLSAWTFERGWFKAAVTRARSASRVRLKPPTSSFHARISRPPTEAVWHNVKAGARS